MNYVFIFRHLSAVCWMLGGFMLFSVPWALPAFGGNWQYEKSGTFGLFVSVGVCAGCALLLRYIGRKNGGTSSSDVFSKKDATAVVAFSWLFATVLGALPFLFSGTQRCEGIPMSVGDAVFESMSGFTTTGATVFAELERPDLLSRCVLFWRCSTHFLGGLGIMVLFVVLLGIGTGSKTLFRSEVASSKNSPKERIRQLARIVFRIFIALNAAQTVLLVLQGLTVYDALCHSFSTTATGGFSTFNAGAGHFAAHGYKYAAAVELTLVLFMFLGGTNFILLYYLFRGQPSKLFGDREWRTYTGIIAVSVLIVFAAGWVHSDFDIYGTSDKPVLSFSDGTSSAAKTAAAANLPPVHSFRVVLFQIVSIITTTGLCTDEFEKWSAVSCGVLVILMFIGGCSGSTSGGFKVFRMICLMKAVPQEIELSYRPNVVRPLLIGGAPVDKEMVHHVIVHFAVLTLAFLCGTFLILCFEPSSTWNVQHVAGDRKLVDTSAAAAACLNNVGAGFGIVGARQNYGIFSEGAKFVYAALMMLGRLELFTVLALCMPRFWNND
ncbi:MAG: TrkH family potassium uptake protein [Planctomycetaceae bacterium]|jgi:trk system potassium uptake protein TrkH|nr:TrkH family potassium uptake protein [Planctomycetaceae bacterium]